MMEINKINYLCDSDFFQNASLPHVQCIGALFLLLSDDIRIHGHCTSTTTTVGWMGGRNGEAQHVYVLRIFLSLLSCAFLLFSEQHRA